MTWRALATDMLASVEVAREAVSRAAARAATDSSRGVSHSAADVARALGIAGVPSVADAQSPKEDAVGLLQLAAEVEHALLVQYLYAAASIDASGGEPSRRARRVITQVAIEEMGHLVAVQNLLLAIGGVTCHHLGRDVLRTGSERNPIPFVLEPVSHAALAKYVAVESPSGIEDPVLRARVEQLRAEAEQAAHASPHHVSALYAAIYWLVQPSDEPFGCLALDAGPFKAGWHLESGDFVPAAVVDAFASTTEDWGGFPGLVVRPVHDAAEACELLCEIMAQGEGAPTQPESHFAAFLQVLDAFEAGRVTVLPVCRTPRVADQPASEDPDATVLTNPYTEHWARLLNTWYTHLVFTLGHALSLPVASAERAMLAGAALDMMRPGLAGLTRQLARLPVGASGTGRAGATFGLLDDTLPTDPAEWWPRHRDHRDARLAAMELLRGDEELASDPSGQGLLQQLVAAVEPLDRLIEDHV